LLALRAGLEIVSFFWYVVGEMPLLEDTTMVISSLASTRIRRLGLAFLLLAVPACGLSDYETLMRDTQEREERFRIEQKYLGKAVQIPNQKKDDKELPLANVFFRLPAGINSKPQQGNDPMWRYAADSRNNDFTAVDMAFAEDDKDFANRVLANYAMAGQSSSPLQITPPGQTTPLTFDRWESGSVSVNILRGSSKPIAIVFICKARPDSVRKVMELSLQSLGIDQTAGAARTRANQTSPWKLQGSPSS
jgi:hypothetical protein